MQFSLQGKTALVTGASRGIGRAIAQRLAADGALVAIHYGGNDTAANETLKAIEQAGGQAFLVKAELGVNEDTDVLFTKLEKELAGRPLDILVNNAAVAPQIAIHQTTPEEFDRLFAINVRAPFFIIQRALPLMPDGGRIINISSGVTWFATPATVYSMTKGALNVLGRSLANSLGPRNITVNTISPGITDTDMCLHTILLDPQDPQRIYVAISAAGAFRSDDGGKTWKPINQGLHSEYIPDPAAEVGHCVHRIAMHTTRPNTLFMVTRLRMPLAIAQLKQLRVTSSAENIDATMPIVSVTAKPLTGPVAFQKRISAVISVVTFESKIALKALSYAAFKATFSGLPVASSSRSRS